MPVACSSTSQAVGMSRAGDCHVPQCTQILTSSVVPIRHVALGVDEVGAFEAVLVLELGVYVGQNG